MQKITETPTAEQYKVLDRAMKGDDFKIMAYAGAGKTSTLKMISQNARNKRGLYLAFNKRLADEAKSKFGSNVQCSTFHSFAFRQSPRWLTEKIRRPRLLPSHVANRFNLRNINFTQNNEKITLTPNQQASMIIKSVGDFCDYSSGQISFKNVLGILPKHIPKSLHLDIADYIVQYSHQLWCDFISAHGQFSIDHNLYFKYWCLQAPLLDFDYLLVDEAQDLSATQFKLVMQQPIQKICCGDASQQIYAWRNAINSMQNLPFASEYLTQSFRFGPNIASVANIILQQALDEERPIKGTNSISSKVYNNKNLKDSNAILCRTNATAFAKFVELSSKNIPVQIAFETSTILKFADDSKKLKNNIPVDSGDLVGFKTWFSLVEYAEQDGDANLKTMIKVIDEYGSDALTELINKSSNTKSELLIATAHKTKGMEFNTVSLEDDFQYSIKDNEIRMSKEEARLIYVAATRAKKNLHLQGIYDLLQALQKPNKKIIFED